MTEVNINLTEDEVAIYDRQIRLWGTQSQKRIIGSNIIVLGLSPINFEFLKDVILSGINVALWDNINVRDQDLELNFLLSQDDIGKSRTSCISKLSEINPMAKISILESDLKAEDLCEKYVRGNEFNGIVVSLDEEIDIITAKTVSKKYSSEKLLCSFSISLGTRFFLFYDNKYIKLSEILELNEKIFKEKLMQIKNLHPYILVILVILREKASNKAKGAEIQLSEIAKDMKLHPKITNEELTNVYNEFNEFWGTTISPISSIAGGLICQEVTKFCTQEVSDYCCCMFDMDTCEAVTAIIK